MKFCPRCATEFLVLDWPRTCAGCGATHYQNPTPVAVAVVPVVDHEDCLVGVLGVQRSASTGKGAGKWALPGGFVDRAEDMVEGAVRELAQETGIIRDRNSCCLLDTAASSDGSCVLVFVLTPPITQEEASKAVADPVECMAVGILTANQELAFDTHASILSRVLDYAQREAHD